MNRVIRRLLLVEDSPSDAVLITSLVEERSAWDVVHVPTNTAATAALENGSFDAVLLDLGLPDGEGLASVRAMRDSFDVPIIVLTARPEATWGTEVVRSGAQDFISKDEADAAGLERALRYAVQRHAQVQQLGRAQRRLQRYARAVAHDVRTPIATIRGFAEMILVEEQTRGAADSRTVDYAERIVSQSKRLLDMAADLLEDATDDTDAVVVSVVAGPSVCASMSSNDAGGFSALLLFFFFFLRFRNTGSVPRALGTSCVTRNSMDSRPAAPLPPAVPATPAAAAWTARPSRRGCAIWGAAGLGPATPTCSSTLS